MQHKCLSLTVQNQTCLIPMTNTIETYYQLLLLKNKQVIPFIQENITNKLPTFPNWSWHQKYGLLFITVNFNIVSLGQCSCTIHRFCCDISDTNHSRSCLIDLFQCQLKTFKDATQISIPDCIESDMFNTYDQYH